MTHAYPYRGVYPVVVVAGVNATPLAGAHGGSPWEAWVVSTEFVANVVAPGAPAVMFETVALPGQRLTFREGVTPSPGTSVREWFWDFGEGSRATGPEVTHGFPDAGRAYLTRLRVVDSTGVSAQASRLAYVPLLPPPDEETLRLQEEAARRAEEAEKARVREGVISVLSVLAVTAAVVLLLNRRSRRVTPGVVRGAWHGRAPIAGVVGSGGWH